MSEHYEDALNYALRFCLTEDLDHSQRAIADYVRDQIPEMRGCSDEAIVTLDTIRRFRDAPDLTKAQCQA